MVFAVICELLNYIWKFQRRTCLKRHIPGWMSVAKVPACGFSKICQHLSYLVMCCLPRCCWFALIKLGALCRPLVFRHLFVHCRMACTSFWSGTHASDGAKLGLHALGHLLLLLLINAHLSFPCLVAACRQRASISSDVGEARSGSHCWSNRGKLDYCVRGLLHRLCMVLIFTILQATCHWA